MNLDFSYFPAYAAFLLKHKLRDMSVAQLQLSKELNLPLLKFFQHFSEDQLIEIGMQGIKELLICCAANKADEYIQTSTQKWLNNQLQYITKSQVLADDVTLLNLIRRKIFRQLITFYTNDVNHAIQILDEIDVFTVASESAARSTFLNLQLQMFKQAQSLAHIGNWQWNLKTKKLSWSDEIYKIYELEPQSEIISAQIASYNHPEDADLVNKHIQWSTETLLPHDFFYRIILKDKRQKILHAKGEVKLNDEGAPVDMYGTLQDVTDQKQKEKQLEDSRRFIEKVADVSPCMISVLNVNTDVFIFVNKAVNLLLGYSVLEFIGKGRSFFYPLINSDDLKIVKDKIAQIKSKNNNEAAAEKILDYTYRIKHKNGTYRWIHTFTTVFNRDKNGNVEEVLNISIDVSQSYILSNKLLESNEKIKQKETQHQRMISDVEDYAILLLNNEGIIQTWNKGAEKIKGYTASEIIGKNFRVFYSKEDRENKIPEQLINEAIVNGRASAEGWRVKKDGSKFWGSIVITALHDDNHNITGFTKVTRNLTEKKLADDKLREYANRIEKHNEELIRINNDLDSFTYMASHDLQEPVRKIKTFCNLILDRADETLSKENTVYFNRIMSAASRMQTLIESLLYYSRATTTDIILEPTDLNNVLSEVKKDLSDIIDTKNVTILAGNLPVLKIMPVQFHQLFLNLIENAIKYSRKNIPPVIKIDAFFNKEATSCTIIISDNGIGFEQQYAENIFKLFQRLHGRKEYSGTGIGLAICKKIVDNHKGTIKAKGEPDNGATFTITIPTNPF